MTNMHSQFACIMDTPLGKLGIRMKESCITAVDYLSANVDTTTQESSIASQLIAYFTNPKHKFELPIQLTGTPFQLRVWMALSDIPSGTTLTYGQLAKKLKSSPRAVGQACRRNPIPIIIPCHRVIGAKKLGGYAGDTSGNLFAVKQWLLQHESAHIFTAVS
jgi:methylated-DNA-[protein]-cysteine S-methyltransferase